jgi:hypothetical protein
MWQKQSDDTFLCFYGVFAYLFCHVGDIRLGANQRFMIERTDWVVMKRASPSDCQSQRFTGDWSAA